MRDAIQANDGVPLTGTGHYTPHNKGMISPAYGMAVMAIKARVGRETGHVEARDVFVVHDCGQVINPLAARGQVEGSIHMGLVYGLYEEMAFDQGMVLNPEYIDYKILRPRDMRRLKSWMSPLTSRMDLLEPRRLQKQQLRRLPPHWQMRFIMRLGRSFPAMC